MKAFSDLYYRLDETTRTNEKVTGLADYFRAADPADAAWAVYFLSGRKLKRVLSSGLMRTWAAEKAGIPEWLFEECYDVVGDLAETIAHLLPGARHPSDVPLHVLVSSQLLPLRDLPEDQKRALVGTVWDSLDTRQTFVWNKLLTGAFRVGVSLRLVTRALAQLAGVDTSVVAHRLMGNWEPTPEFYVGLLGDDTTDTDRSRPYPFFLAHPVDSDPDSLGPAEQWMAEWKWDGVRAQVIRRAGEAHVWSRGEELVTEQFPEIAEGSRLLPDGTVLDGEILAWGPDGPLPFNQLQRRLGRKKPGARILKEIPVSLLAFDVLEAGGEDVRTLALSRRRALLADLLGRLGVSALKISQEVPFRDWEELSEQRERSRELGVEGLMLKNRASTYQVGRPRGDWWKWKVEPFTVDAVLIYAQRGHGRRASLYTDYTFAVWDGPRLVPVAKAYSGLSDEEILQVDRFVRANTVERFGPVRSVKPELVFELSFEGIQASGRHRSGVALRFPRMTRWRLDKKFRDADTLESLRDLIK